MSAAKVATDASLQSLASKTETSLDGVANAILQVASAINAESGVIYGFHIDGSESDPDERVTYLKDAIGMTPAGLDSSGSFNYGSWKNAFFMPRPCMLKSSGLVNYYLDPDDYTKKEDGTASDVANTSYAGNAMMEWGKNGRKIWMKIVPDSDPKSASVYIADHQADSEYHDWPFHNCNGVSVDHFYTPIYNGSIVNDGTNDVLRSLSGQTVSKSLTAAAEIAAAQANNPGTDILWNTELHSDIVLINMLLILIGKSTNTQAVFGYGLRDSGSETVNDGFTTGVHNDKGLFYGTNTGAAATYTNAVKVFGMENWWGFQWRRYQGHICADGYQYVKNTYGTEDGTTVSAYNLTGDGYIKTATDVISETNSGYISQMHFTAEGMFPEVCDGGSSTTYYCDGAWYSTSATKHVAFRGGASGDGGRVGAFCVALYGGAAHAAWGIGAALSCKPLA